jgi:hypothetical protein
MIWVEAAAAALLAAGCAWRAWRAGRLPGKQWERFFAGGLLLLALLALVNHIPGASASRWLGWVEYGRLRYWFLAVAIPAVLLAPCPRLPRRLEQGLVLGGGLAATLALGVGPFLLPALLAGQHRQLHSSFDANGVCRQPTAYTCGPAAAVTALRRLGIEADLGELTVESRAAPMFGTRPSMLCRALERRYRAQGLRCRRWQYTSVDQLAGPTVHVIELRLAPMIDHWSAVLGRTPAGFVLGDPLQGREVVPAPDLSERWRGRGIVLWRDQPTTTVTVAPP